MRKVIERCDFRVGDKIDHKYRVEKILGEGSFGKVFKVINTETQKVHALKLLKLWEIQSEIRDQLTDRFQMEFETGQIESNYLVHSIDYGYTKGNPYIVMEFCSGGDLLQFVNNRRDPDLIKIATEVLYGLRDLHQCGKVHRDLKPENVLVKETGQAVLTDFGISGDRNKRMTERNIWGKPEQIFGTYGYMPPEQVNPHKDATVLPTTDIFSFGVMIYQLITTKLPFGQLNNHDDLVIYLKNGREGKWDRRSLTEYGAIGKTFEQIIEKCLIPDFKQRLQTVNAVLEWMPKGGNSYKPNMDQAVISMSIKNGLLLRIMQGEEYGKVYKLNELIINRKKIITMGREDIDIYNTIPIMEQQSCYISRKHCTLEFDDIQNQWYIRDGQWDKNSTNAWKRSLNGTYINSTEVSPNGKPVYPGDIISIGDVKIRVEGY
jgi:serine/threonine protein kinase